MNWRLYLHDFRSQARSLGRSEKFISRCISYARKLHKSGLPIIFDQEHLAALVGFDIEYLRRVSNQQEKFYRTFEIRKKSGGKRIISEPLPNLKEIQHWLLRNVLVMCKVTEYAKAFRKRRSIRHNARYHTGQQIVICLDVENFFGNIKTGAVTRLFRSLGYSRPVAKLMASLCTLNNSLPQGAPTSPAISNLVMRGVDSRLARFAQINKIKYTRYADDLTFSGSHKPSHIINIVRKVLLSMRLTINESKTRIMRQENRQIVTGIVVNKSMKAPREIRRSLRTITYFIEKFGLESHMNQTNEKHANHLGHLLGKANFVLMIDPEDKNALNARKVLSSYLHSTKTNLTQSNRG